MSSIHLLLLRPMELTYIIVCILGGFVAGIINTFAGNGSAITISILMDLIGLPPNVANATNRIGVLFQTGASSVIFTRGGLIDFKRSKAILVWCFIGAMIGLYTVTQLSNESFRTVFKYLMVIMLIVILVNPKRWLGKTQTDFNLPMAVQIPLWLAVGFYGGFIQLGMGVYFLALLVLVAKYSMMDANAIKVLAIFLYTIVVLAIFQYQGLVEWQYGGLIALGQFSGAVIASRWATRYENTEIWAYRLLVTIIILVVLNLFGFFDWIMTFV